MGDFKGSSTNVTTINATLVTADDLEVDSTTLSVDADNNKVGIGLTSPKTKLTVEGTVTLKEQANAEADTAAYGQLWVKSDTPNDLYFTNDAGNDVRITNGAGLAAAPGASVSADDINVGDNNVSVSGGSGHSLTLNATAATAQLKTTTSGEVDITSAANIDINAATTLTIDSADDSNLTVTASGKDLDIAVAGGGTQELRLASAGTGASAIHLNASAGGVNIDSADMIDIDAADEITIDTTSEDGHIAITSAHTSGQSILISADAHAGAILDIDAGILDVDIQAAATIDAVGIALGAGSGELDLTTTGTLDVNANALDMDLTDSSSITITSSEAAEDLTIEQVGANDSSIIIQAAGTGTDAIKIDATAGDMLIAPSLANGKTLKIGPTSATEMVFTPHGTAANEKISLTNTSGTAADAVSIVSTAGGITLTGDTDHGVLVGTVSGGPISIGHTTSETTVNHNLTVTGTATITSGDVSLGNGQAAVIAVNDTASGTAGKSLTVSAGAAPAASGNTNGGDLILSSGAGDGTGTSSMQFKTKVSNTDSVAERMRIHTDGKVGIGVADPDVQLEVFAAATQLKLSYDASNSSTFDVDSTGDITITPSGGDCTIRGDLIVRDQEVNKIIAQIFDNSDDGVIAGYQDNVVKTLLHANSGSHFLGGELGVGVALDGAFTGLFEVQQGASGGKSAVAIINEDIDKIALDINASNTTGNVIDVVANALTTGKAIFIDHNDTATAAVTPVGIHIDFDKSGVTGDGVISTFTGLDIDVNDAATNHSGADVTQTGASIAVASANAQGALLNVGMQISTTGADENIQLALVDDASVIAFGADSDTTLTHVHDTGLILNSSRQIQFGDAATHIKQVSDSNLEIEADGSIILDTPVVSFEDDGTILKFGANSEVTLTHVHDTGLLLSDASGVGTTKLMFGDAACFIQQQADGQLGIDADSIINITAPTLDIDASTAVTMTTPSLVIESATGEKPLVVIKNTANDVDGAILRFVKDKGAAGAANDFNGRIQFFGDDAAQDQVKFSEITSQVKVHTNGQEGGKLSFLVAENDGTATAGLIIEDGDADGELDVTIGAGLASVTAVSGGLQVNGPLIAVMPNVHNFTGNDANATIPVTTASAQIDGDGFARTGMRFASAGTAGQILVVINTGGENVVFDTDQGTALLRGTNTNKDTILPGEAHIFVSDGSLWNHVGGGKTDEGLTG